MKLITKLVVYRRKFLSIQVHTTKSTCIIQDDGKRIEKFIRNLVNSQAINKVWITYYKLHVRACTCLSHQLQKYLGWVHTILLQVTTSKI